MSKKSAFEQAQEEYLQEFPDPICLSCKYYVDVNKCLAFPTKGIPVGFMSGRLEHREVVEGQVGTFVFEEKR